MLKNSIWRQYNDTLEIYKVLSSFYAPWEMELIENEVTLHNILKAKLTKKEFRLFAMLSGNTPAQTIQERFGYTEEELQKATDKLYKKLKQDKVRLAFRKNENELDSFED